MSARCIIVCDGESWFVRELDSITHDLDTDTKVYRAPAPISGPWSSPGSAAKSASEWQKRQHAAEKDGRITDATLRRLRTFGELGWITDIELEYRDGRAIITSMRFPPAGAIPVVLDTEVAARKILDGVEASRELAIAKQKRNRRAR